MADSLPSLGATAPEPPPARDGNAGSTPPASPADAPHAEPAPAGTPDPDHWLFARFERWLDPFTTDAPDDTPPTGIAAFYARYLRQAWPAFAVLLVVGLGTAMVEVALFDYLGRIVDWVQKEEAAGFVARHGGELAWMLVVALLLRPLTYGLHDLISHQAITPSLTTLVRWQHHRYVLRQNLAFFENDFAGRIANRVMQTGNALRDSAVQMVDAIWYVVVYTGGALWLFASADWRLAMPLAAWVVGYLLALRHFVPRVEARSTLAAEASSKLMGRIVDGYSNVATLKLFAHTRLEERYAREALAEQTQRSREAGRVVVAMDFSITVLNGFFIAGTTAAAVALWSAGRVTGGDIALSVGLAIRITNMSGWIMWVVSGIFENIGTVRDGMETIARPHAVVDAPDAAPLAAQGPGAIRFEAVRFHYGRAAGAIEHVDLAVAPGEKVGLVGPSGAGKSTLVSLLLRLHDVAAGRVLVDGQDIAQLTQESLRASIGVVTQDTALLHRSIRDNLLYGRPGASEAEVWQALTRARADGFVHELQDGEGRRGLDAHVGERGVKLSGGQRQRVAIARVLLKNAPILVLDEATAALDSETEAAIQESLDLLTEGRTVIAIAHRLSTIARMDRLVVLDRGRIVETGSHAELLAQGGLYARLWTQQTGGFLTG